MSRRCLAVPAGHVTRPNITTGSEFIPIGPKGQDILRPYLLREKESSCFRPVDSEKRNDARHNMKTARRRCRAATVRAQTGGGSRSELRASSTPPDSYRRAIHRACDKAGVRPVVTEPPTPLRRNGDSQTVRAGSRPSHPGARIGRRHPSLCRTGSAKGGGDYAGGGLTRKSDVGSCISQHKIERCGHAERPHNETQTRGVSNGRIRHGGSS